MSSEVRLFLLRCPECSSNLSGEKEGVFLYCGGCGAGFRLDADQLIKVPVYFARLNPNSQSFQPFWAFDATLEVRNMDANRGISSFFKDRRGLVQLFKERGTVRMYVPASAGELTADQPRALRLTMDQPELEYIGHMPQISGFTVGLEDAEKVADFLLLTSEIQQPDMMRKLDYSLHLNNPMIVVIGS